jgi:hypothetical protein
MNPQPEVWLRGPIPGIDPLLQPAAHALLQAGEDVQRVLAELSTRQIWARPGGAARVAFHVLHLMGSTDRLLTYARGEALTEQQRSRLAAERDPEPAEMASLVAALRAGIDAAIAQLSGTPSELLLDARTVGRAALPTNVVGLLFHAAEHAQRHAGQIVTTAKIILSRMEPEDR